MEIAGCGDIGIAEVRLDTVVCKAGAIGADHSQKEADVEVDMAVDSLLAEDHVAGL
jgi:hypothetical protein